MKKILLIEDDPFVANAYGNRLKFEGFDVQAAADGQAGLEAIQQFRPDAVVLDLMLPRLSGIELMKTVRGRSEFEKLPIVVLSSTYHLTGMVQQAYKAGATKCLSKVSCTPSHIIAILNGVLAGSDGSANPAVLEAPPAARSLKALSSPPAALAPLPAARAEAKSDAELQASFFAGLPAALAALRALLPGLLEGAGQASRRANLQQFYHRVHALTASTGLAGIAHAFQMADVLEVLLKEVDEHPRHLTASVVRTIASATDALGVLFARRPVPDRRGPLPPAILIIDDEPISRRAITRALANANLRSFCLRDPLVACDFLADNRCDLIFLDIDMPRMSGLELCAKVRGLPAHRKTPVVFVTRLNDFKSRASSCKSGGTDFIAKPFLAAEVALKALVHCARARLEAVAC